MLSISSAARETDSQMIHFQVSFSSKHPQQTCLLLHEILRKSIIFHWTNSAKILCCSVVVGVPQPTAGEGDELERNPAYQTSASLIPSSSNPSYAGLNVIPHSRIPLCAHARVVVAADPDELMPAECYQVSYEDEVSSCVVSTDVFTSCSTRWSHTPGSR